MEGSIPLSNKFLVNTTNSPFARLQPIPLTAVRLTDNFWQPRRERLRQVGLPAQYRLCEETGRIDNFRRAARRKEGAFIGLYFNDSDVYKWLEATAWTLVTEDDTTLREMMETVVEVVIAAQEPDGYLNTYFTFERAGDRWANLRDMHELYCAGHLIQAAIAHRRATGSDQLFDAARRFADRISRTFGPGEGQIYGTGGHEEIEMALVELYRETGEDKYLRQAQFFLDVRGQGTVGGRPYHQDHQPFRGLKQLAGHAVRALYYTAGATDIYAETGEEGLWTALERLWDAMVGGQMYISGGVGSRHEGESFGEAYELPNARAYAETCAAVANVMWNWRLLALDGDARYADLLELVLYNAMLAGISLDGEHYFYMNPLASDGNYQRQPWFDCACCPPNIARRLGALPAYFYSISAEGVWVHLYASSEVELSLADGLTVRLTQQTDYPWDGEIRVIVEDEGEFALRLRIPGWCEGAVRPVINGQPFHDDAEPGSYAIIRRNWAPGDEVRLNLPMPPRRVVAHPYVTEDTGHVALMRGPLLYCVEGADHPGIDLRGVCLTDDAPIRVEFQADLLGGVATLHTDAESILPGAQWKNRLYRTLNSGKLPLQGERVSLMAVPYYAWANRASGQMRVWLRRGSGSPLDVEGINLDLTADEIVRFIHEGRRSIE